MIWAVYFLSGKSFLSLTWAGLCGLLASFSFNSGLLIWPVGLAYLIGSKVEKKLLAYWSAIGLFTAATYLVDYHPVPNVPSPLQVLFQPITAIPFFLANYGASLGGGYFKSSVVMGVLLLGSIIILLYGRRKNGEMFVITDSDLTVLSLVFFSILSSIAITAGRFWNGFGTAIASRYMTITSLGVYGIYMLFLRTASLGANGSSNSNSDSNNFVRYFHALVAVILIGLVATYLFGVKRGIELHEDRTNMKYALQSFCGQPDETLQAMYPTANVFRERAVFLCSEGLSVFGEVPQVGNTTMTNCCLCPVDRAP